MLHTTYVGYRKIPKIGPRALFFQRPFLRGLSTKGNLRFKIAWACLIVEKKFTVFALYLRAISPGGRLFAGAYFWNFTVLQFKRRPFLCQLAPEPLMENSSERRLKDKNLVLLSEMKK